MQKVAAAMSGVGLGNLGFPVSRLVTSHHYSMSIVNVLPVIFTNKLQLFIAKKIIQKCVFWDWHPFPHPFTKIAENPNTPFSKV